MGTRHLLNAMALAALLGGCARGEDTWDISIDTHPDTGGDTGWDPGWDPGWDTGLDPGADTGWDTGHDTGYDPGVDPGTDTGCPSPCGLVPQCGCPSGQKCSLVGSARGCVAAGSGTKASACTSDSQCAAGFICLELYTTEGATDSACYPFCTSDVHCPGGASVCFEAFTGTTDSICSLGCNLLNTGASGCPTGSKCILLQITSTGENITDCTADAGYGVQGSACTLESQCGQGTFCGSSGGVDECIGYCTIYPSDSCSWGCQNFVDEYGSPVTISFDGTQYGYCYF